MTNGGLLRHLGGDALLTGAAWLDDRRVLGLLVTPHHRVRVRLQSRRQTAQSQSTTISVTSTVP